MKYSEFKNKFKNLPVIFSKDLMRFRKNTQILRNQLNRWQKKRLIIKLKRGAYLLNKDDRKINLSKFVIANQLYGPSYVSLEYALNFYGLIPERTFDITSVSTRKTKSFQNELGVFVYQHINPVVFRGFRKNVDESGLPFFIAEPEKAIVDFLYLNLNKFRKNTKDLFGFSYRFQNVETLKSRKIIEWVKLYNNSRLLQVAKDFCEFIKKEATK